MLLSACTKHHSHKLKEEKAKNGKKVFVYVWVWGYTVDYWASFGFFRGWKVVDCFSWEQIFWGVLSRLFFVYQLRVLPSSSKKKKKN